MMITMRCFHDCDNDNDIMVICDDGGIQDSDAISFPMYR